MSEKFRKRAIMIIRLLPLIVCAVLVVVCLFHKDRFTVENILSSAPQNRLMLSLAIVLLYAVKSITVVFPMLVINVASGMVLPPIWALAVNTVGVTVMSAIPYFIGRLSGAELYEKLKKRYPRVKEILASRENNVIFYSFFLRIINCLPGDIVSMCFGAVKARFGKFLFGSVLGIFPGIVLATYMGKGIMEPESPTFIIALGINVALSVISIVIDIFYERSKKKNVNN